MTSDLQTLRETISAALSAAGIPAFSYLPDRLNPPLALVQPGSPYLEPSTTAGYRNLGWNVRNEVILVVPPGDKKVQTGGLDQLIEDSLTVLATWGIVQVGQPYVLQVGDTQYLATRIQLLTKK